MRARQPGWERLRIAVEDRFVILKLQENKALLPEGRLLDCVADNLGAFDDTYSILCDWRGLRELTNDVIEFVDVLCNEYGAIVLAGPHEVDFVRGSFNSDIPVLQVWDKHLPLSYSDLDLSLFDVPGYPLALEPSMPVKKYSRGPKVVRNSFPDESEWRFMCNIDPYLEDIFPTYESLVKEYCRAHELENDITVIPGGDALFRRRYLEMVLATKGRNSLLTEFALQVAGDDLLITPYHAHALHSIEVKDQLVLGRPGVLASKTGTLLREEISALERLLADPKVREANIQNFLESHPSIFRAIGYSHVYPQIVLQRSDGTSLRPDFILEPAGADWCDILDLKIPDMKTIVGGRDRKTLSSYVHELAAQLREYAAYFEDERLSKRVEDAFGIKCYRPRLIGIVGRDTRLADERQLRRLMTAYADLSIVTFDQLLKIAKNRLLI